MRSSITAATASRIQMREFISSLRRTFIYDDDEIQIHFTLANHYDSDGDLLPDIIENAPEGQTVFNPTTDNIDVYKTTDEV